MRLRIKANFKAERSPAKKKWDPTIKHKKEVKVLIPDVLLKGTYQDLIADVVLDPVSNGYDAVVEVMGHKVRAWGQKIKEAQDELTRKVQDLVKEMGWDVAPPSHYDSYGAKVRKISSNKSQFTIRLVKAECGEKRCPKCGKNIVETDGRCVCTGCGADGEEE
jgi:hypothetical protein